MKKKVGKYLPWVVSVLIAVMLISAQVSMKRMRNSLKHQQTDLHEVNEQLQRNLYFAEKANADDLFFEGRLEEAAEIYLRLAPDSSLWNERIGKLSEREAEQMSWEANMRNLNRKLEKSLKELEEIKTDYHEKMLVSEKENTFLKLKSDSLKKEVKALNNELKKAKGAYSRLSFSSKKNTTVHYVGQVSGGKANGKGLGFWTTGSMYEGNWSENMRHGKGEFTWADGEKYIGEHAHDQREGYGVYQWKNGERYEGYWKEDRRNGEGTLYDNKGKVKYAGKWVNDEPATK